MKWIIVTGGAGFIGSAVLKDLEKEPFSLLVVDELTQDLPWKNLVGKTFADIIAKEALFAWLPGKEIHAIFHLGACSSTLENDAGYLLENNYRYTIRLAEYAVERGIRFIYASSAATYGMGTEGFSDAHGHLTKLSPLNMYGFSKHLVDLWMMRQGYLDKVVALKYFNVFGPNEYHKGRMASAILKMVSDVQTKGKISLFRSSDQARFKDGEQVRDFIYVKDAVKMTVQFLHHPFCGIYNIGTGRPSTWNQLAASVLEATQRGAEIEYIAMPQDLEGKYQNYTCAEMKKSEERGLYLPRSSLEENVTQYVQEYVLPRKYL